MSGYTGLLPINVEGAQGTLANPQYAKVRFLADSFATGSSFATFTQLQQYKNPQNGEVIIANSVTGTTDSQVAMVYHNGVWAPLQTGAPVVLFANFSSRIAAFPVAQYAGGTLLGVNYGGGTNIDLLYASDSLATGWNYLAGTIYTTLSVINGLYLSMSLTANDTGLLAYATDYCHLYLWTGAAWTWGPGDQGSRYIQYFDSASPNLGAGAWQILDGSTVNVSNPDTTTTSVTVSDAATHVVGGIGTGVFIKAAATYSATVGGTTPTSPPSATTTVQSGTGVSVASSTHTHLTGWPSYITAVPFLRR